MENGEYLRSSEIDEEQNYNMIDGRRNNMSPKGKNGRVSVLAKLRRKQAEIAKRSGKPAQQMAMAEDRERRRKLEREKCLANAAGCFSLFMS